MSEALDQLVRLPQEDLERDYRDSEDFDKRLIFDLAQRLRRGRATVGQRAADDIFNELSVNKSVTLAWNHTDIEASLARWAAIIDGEIKASAR